MARFRPDRQRAKAEQRGQSKPSTVGLSADESLAIDRMIGQPLQIDNEQEETNLEYIAALQQHLRAITAPPPTYRPQQDFHYFLTHWCWTADEARGGYSSLIPDWPYIKEISDALIERDLLLMEKSRRVLASWICCCFDIWLAAGGQDPRWPQLMYGTENRQIFVADRKFESAARFLRRRHLFILNAFKLNNGFSEWPTFPVWMSREGEIEFANNALITAVAQGSDQLRGAGATFIHLEELAFWEAAQATVEGMTPTLQGGGHAVAITTPSAGSYASMIVQGKTSSHSYR